METKLKHIVFNNNKIPIIFKRHESLPIFNLQLVFQNSGYMNDTKKSGLTNISAKILNEGNSKISTNKFYEVLENNAIEIYAQTGFETFVIEISCLKENYELALKYLNKILKNPNISENALNKIKKIQLSKLAQKDNDYDFIASSTLKSKIYNKTALENTSIGSKRDITDITLIDVKNNLKNILDINNLIIVSGGDIKYTELKEKLNHILKPLNNNNKIKINKIPFNSNNKNVYIKKDTQQSYIYFASPFNIEHDSNDNYKMKVASFILGASGFGSRLMEEIRVKNGLAYSVHAYYENKKSHSYFTGYLQTKIENTNKAKEMVEKIVSNFVKKGSTQNELDLAIKFISGSQPLKTETFSQNLNQAFNLYYNGKRFDYANEELNLIKSLSLRDLNKFISEHSEIENLIFSILTK